MKSFPAVRHLVFLFILSVIAVVGNATAQHAPIEPVPVCVTSLPLNGANELDSTSFLEKKAEFIAHMAATHGFNKAELECSFSQIHSNDRVSRLVRPAQSIRFKNWKAYRARFVEPIRVKAGAAFWEKYETALALAEKQYGVPAEIIVGIIGVETIYGRNTGNFRVLDVLATLAFDYPDILKRKARMMFFRNELEQTLLYARESGIDPRSLRGSYAGAVGWPQFMPGSIRRYAVDFDGDGKIDLINSPVDAIGSVANFLAEHGWKRGYATVFPANVDSGCGNPLSPYINQGLAAKNTLDDLKTACVSVNMQLPEKALFGLVDLQNGLRPTEYWLGTENFFAITHYNRSYFYAMSVIDLGRAVRAFRNSR